VGTEEKDRGGKKGGAAPSNIRGQLSGPCEKGEAQRGNKKKKRRKGGGGLLGLCQPGREIVIGGSTGRGKGKVRRLPGWAEKDWPIRGRTVFKEPITGGGKGRQTGVSRRKWMQSERVDSHCLRGWRQPGGEIRKKGKNSVLVVSGDGGTLEGASKNPS